MSIIKNLMFEVVERTRSKQRHQAAYRRILERRPHVPTFTEAQLRDAREKGRE